MKKTFTHALLLAAGLAVSAPSQATVYTAGTSGAFTSTSTWLGGVVPPATLGGDNIIVNTGVTVTLDVNLQLNTIQSLLQMNGNAKITSTSSNYISLAQGSIVGTAGALIDVDSVYIDDNNTFGYNGTITANKLTLNISILPDVVMNAKNQMHIMKNLSLNNNTTIVLGSSTVTANLIMQGTLSYAPPALLTLVSNYNLTYRQGVTTIGSSAELMGSGLTDIEIDMGTGNSVTLDANLTVNNKLKLTSGSLALTNNNNKLLMKGTSSFDGTGGFIHGDNTSVIEITSSATSLGTVNFLTNQRILKNLVMNTSSPTAVLKLGTNLNIQGTLDLQSGLLNVQANTLTIDATLGQITSASASSYVMTETGGQLQIDVPAGLSMDYPVGHANGYTPISVSDMGTAGMASLGVNVAQGVKTNGTSGADIATSQPVVDATWTLMGTVATPHYSIEVMWPASLEKNSFDRSKYNVAAYTASKWNPGSTDVAGNSGSMYTGKKEHLGALSPFAVFDENTKVSVSDVVITNKQTVFPNPARNMLHVEAKGNAQAVVTNIAGQVVLQAQLTNGMNSIGITDIKPGMYFINIAGDNMNGTAKFIKQ